ncbi:hypothetical protein PIB30_089955, partial [Stylosanthes scabra]|nr:hypothetical protein [Stylosanthes scabra]
ADTSAAHNGVTDMISRIQDLMRRDWRVELFLIQRSANSVADTLAKYAVVHEIDQLEWIVPNDDMKELLKHDITD